MPDDFEKKLNSIPDRSSNDDFESRLDAVNTPSKGNALTSGIKAFAGNIIPGLAEIPEQLINASQFANRHLPLGMLNEMTPFTSNKAPYIDALNKFSGAPPQPYLDVTGQIKRTPWFFGQSPEQLSKESPIAGMAGNLVGSIPAAMAMPELGLTRGLSPLAKLGTSALGGAGYGAGFSGLDEAANEIKSNDQLNPQAIAQAAGAGAAVGGGLGILGGSIAGGLRANRYKNLLAQRGAQQLERSQAQLGNTIPHSAEQLERVEQGGSSMPAWEQYEPGQLGPEFKGEVSEFAPTKDVYGKVLPPEEGVSPQQIEDKVSDIHDSWRTRREAQSRPAGPEETTLLEGLARLATLRDKVAGRLASAIEQIERRLGLKPKARAGHIAPDFDDIRLAFVKEHGGIPKGTKGPYIEATLAPDSTHTHSYEFKAAAIRPKMHELKGLIQEYRVADKNYQDAKFGLADKLPVNETIQVTIKDDKGAVRNVNVRSRVQATGFDWPAEEIEKTYNALKAELSAASGPYIERTPEVLQALINDAIKGGHQTLEYLRDHGSLDWFKRQSSKTKTGLVIGISLAAAMYLGKDQQAQAAPPPNKLIGKVINTAAKSGWASWMGSRPIVRLTLSEVTSDIIRKGNPAFGRVRDAYLAQLRRAQENPVLAEKLNNKYAEALQGEIAKLDKQKIQSGLFGQKRLRRALEIDLEDLMGERTGAREGTLERIYSKLFGGVIKSQFWGNYRAATMHILEAGVSFASKHPIASADAIKGLASNPIYRDFAKANSPKGMFQQTLEGTESFEPKIVKRINEEIDKAIKSLPGGETIYGAISAQLPEQGKLGFGALVTALHHARNYPGGSQQYMRDWVALERKGTPVPYARQAQFAKIEVDCFVEENKAIMSMPEGPLKERTIFQRHKLLTPLFPYLRAITQQTRFFSSLIDDLLEAIANKDAEAAANAIKALLLGHVMVAMAAGSHALPDYIWSILSGIDQVTTGSHKDVDNLKGLIDATQKHILGGYQLQDFGIKYFAIIRSPQIGLISIAEDDLRNLKPKDRDSVMRLAATTLAMTLINRIGPEGTINLAYLAERLERGMKGKETYRKYDQSIIAEALNKIMGRPFARKLVEQTLPFDTWQALIHWLFKLENPAEVAAIEQGEKKGAKLVQQDMKKISKAWQQVLFK